MSYVQSGGLLSLVPLGRHMLGWMFKAEEFGTKQVLKQLKAANLLSYAAVEDIITTGMVNPLQALHLLQPLTVSQQADQSFKPGHMAQMTR